MSGAEFRNAMFNIGLEYMGNHIDALFTSWDFTGDGMISYSELEYALKTKPVRVPPLHTHAHLSRTPITHTYHAHLSRTRRGLPLVCTILVCTSRVSRVCTSKHASSTPPSQLLPRMRV